jgi:hypothetical protein
MGSLAWVLYGLCRELKAVTLNPLPEACCGTLNGPLTVRRREEFVFALLNEGRGRPQCSWRRRRSLYSSSDPYEGARGASSDGAV